MNHLLAYAIDASRVARPSALGASGFIGKRLVAPAPT